MREGGGIIVGVYKPLMVHRKFRKHVSDILIHIQNLIHTDRLKTCLTHLCNGFIKHSTSIISSLTNKVHLPSPRVTAKIFGLFLQDLIGYL